MFLREKTHSCLNDTSHCKRPRYFIQLWLLAGTIFLVKLTNWTMDKINLMLSFQWCASGIQNWYVKRAINLMGTNSIALLAMPLVFAVVQSLFIQLVISTHMCEKLKNSILLALYHFITYFTTQLKTPFCRRVTLWNHLWHKHTPSMFYKFYSVDLTKVEILWVKRTYLKRFKCILFVSSLEMFSDFRTKTIIL